MSIHRALSGALFVILVLGSGGCTGSRAVNPVDAVQQLNVGQRPTDAGQQLASSNLPTIGSRMANASSTMQPEPPFICTIGVDVSGSGDDNRIPTIRVEDLAPLIARVERAGGACGLGLIDERPDRTLARMQVAPPPAAAAPYVPPTATPAEMCQNRSITERPACIRDETTRRTAAQQASNDAQARYQAAQSAWQTATNAEVTRFKDDVRARLATPRGGNTDIWTTVARLNLMLSEPTPAFVTAPVRAMILVTDGEQTLAKTPSVTSLAPGTAVFVANGAGLLGVLAPLQPQPFESAAAAIAAAVAPTTPRP